MRLDCAETEAAFLRKRIGQLEERLEREQQSKTDVEQKAGHGEDTRVCKRACGNAGGAQGSKTALPGSSHYCPAAAFGLTASLAGPGATPEPTGPPEVLIRCKVLRGFGSHTAAPKLLIRARDHTAGVGTGQL